jgi:hypothetical protein
MRASVGAARCSTLSIELANHVSIPDDAPVFGTGYYEQFVSPGGCCQ